MPGVPHQAANDGLPWPTGQDGQLKRHGYPKRHRWDFLVANEHTSRCLFNGEYKPRFSVHLVLPNS